MYMTLDEIKKNLSRSDAAFIGKNLGYTPVMVRMVLNGDRNNDKIIEAATIMAKNNISLQQQIAAMAGE